MAVAGVDYGVRRIAYSHPDANHFDELIIKHKDDNLALLEMSNWLSKKIKATRPELVVIEHPIQGASRNVRTAMSMSMVAGALVVASLKLKKKTEMVWPSTWKKDVLGHGYADKETISEWLARRHPEYYETCSSFSKPQDVIDATCIALYGKKGLARRRIL